MDIHKVRTEPSGQGIGQPEQPADELVIHLEHGRLEQELHLVDVDEVALALLHADVRIEEVLALSPLGLAAGLI